MENRRILITDDNTALHDDFKKILLSTANQTKDKIRDLESALRGEDLKTVTKATSDIKYQIDFATQGEEALNKVVVAQEGGHPYALVFMDVRMPPGWDGITTIKKIWERAPYTEIVICTAYSDYSLDDVIAQLGISDRFLFLKKPFDSVEVQQLALALTTKWNLGHLNRKYANNLEELVKQKTKEVETERARSINSAKLAALGEMAAGIAHEINNPLAIIQSNIGFMKDVVEEGFDKALFLKMACKIEETTTRVAKIIKGLRSFARAGENDPFESMSIEQTIQETLGICTEKFKIHDVTLTFERPETKIMVECRQTQLIQVFLNLLNNAYDAVQEYPEKWVKVQVKNVGDFVEVWITDSGKGIFREVQEKLFTPFFTTKGIGKGTGLGLSVSKGILAEHHGTLSLAQDCANTRFVVRLPQRQFLITQKNAG